MTFFTIFIQRFYVQRLIHKTLNGQREKKCETLFLKRKTSVPFSSLASFWVAIVWVAIVLGGNFPGWQLSRVAIVLGGNCPGWKLSRVAIVPVGNCLGCNCLGWQLSGWQLSRVAIVLGVAIIQVAIVLSPERNSITLFVRWSFGWSPPEAYLTRWLRWLTGWLCRATYAPVGLLPKEEKRGKQMQKKLKKKEREKKKERMKERRAFSILISSSSCYLRSLIESGLDCLLF
jgi:hypothetical protein